MPWYCETERRINCQPLCPYCLSTLAVYSGCLCLSRFGCLADCLAVCLARQVGILLFLSNYWYYVGTLANYTEGGLEDINLPASWLPKRNCPLSWVCVAAQFNTPLRLPNLRCPSWVLLTETLVLQWDPCWIYIYIYIYIYPNLGDPLFDKTTSAYNRFNISF